MAGAAPVRGCLALIIGLLAGLVPAGSAAYVRARSEATGAPLHWAAPSKIVLVPSGRAAGLSVADVERAAREALAAWSRPAVSCTAVVLALAPPSAAASAAKDGVNALVFRTNRWCKDVVHTRRDCYDPQMMAITTTYARQDAGSAGGEIEEADIEVNAVDYRWGVRAPGSDSLPDGTRDLCAMLAHELGHVLGLAHNCDDGMTWPKPRDHRGNPAPPCTSAPAGIDRALMSPETRGHAANPSGGTLSADEREALCAIYPAAGGCACAAVGARAHHVPLGAGPSILAIALAMAHLRTRSRRGRGPCAAIP